MNPTPAIECDQQTPSEILANIVELNYIERIETDKAIQYQKKLQ